MVRGSKPTPKPREAKPPTRSPTTDHVTAAAALLLVARLSLVPIRSDDLFFYLELGRRLFTDGRLPETDPYLFTLAGYRWEVLHEWGSFALAYALYAVGGWGALIAGKTLLIALAYSLPLVLARLYGFRSLLVPVVITTAAFAGAPRFVERSSLFSDVLGTAMLAAMLAAGHVGDGVRRWTPHATLATFALWANLHPGFLGGLVILGLHALSRVIAGQPWRRPALLAAGAALACVLNPQGPRVFLYPLRPLLDAEWAAYRATNLEWRSTLHPANLGLTSTHAFLALVVLCAFLLARALFKKTLRARDEAAVFTLLAGAWLTSLGSSAARFVLPASLGLALIATRLARDAIGKEMTRVAAVFSLTFAAAIVYVVLQRETPGDRLPLPVPGSATLLDETLLPIRASDALERLPADRRVFNQHEFGGYLIWRWGGQRKVFYHGFVTDLRFYREDYVAVNRSVEDFARIVAKYDIDTFLLATYPASATEGPLLYRTLLSSREWRLVHADEAAMLFVKTTR